MHCHRDLRYSNSGITQRGCEKGCCDTSRKQEVKTATEGGLKRRIGIWWEKAEGGQRFEKKSVAASIEKGKNAQG